MPKRGFINIFTRGITLFREINHNMDRITSIQVISQVIVTTGKLV